MEIYKEKTTFFFGSEATTDHQGFTFGKAALFIIA